MNQAVVFRFGLLLGVVSILSMLIAYMVDLTWLVSGWNSMISIGLVFAAMFMRSRVPVRPCGCKVRRITPANRMHMQAMRPRRDPTGRDVQPQPVLRLRYNRSA